MTAYISRVALRQESESVSSSAEYQQSKQRIWVAAVTTIISQKLDGRLMQNSMGAKNALVNAAVHLHDDSVRRCGCAMQ